MSAQHTPGPWTVAIADPTSVWAGGHYIAETFTDGEANACLIVAAPEMLDALKAALPVVERIANTRPTQDGRRERQVKAAKVLKDVRAAIAKAEGRS